MPLTTHLDVVSAEALIFSGPVTQVVVPAESGEICILARHAPLLTRMRAGLVRLKTHFEGEQTFFVSSGFLEVQPDHITVLADTVLRAPDMDETAAAAAVEQARRAMAERPSAADYDRLKAELDLELALLRAIDSLRKRTSG